MLCPGASQLKTLTASHLAQELWLKEGPKECVQGDKYVEYGICFGLRLPPLFTELVAACGFVSSLWTEWSLNPEFADFSVLARLPSQHCTALPHLGLLAKASLGCFSRFSEKYGEKKKIDYGGTEYWSTQSHAWPLEIEGTLVLKMLNPDLCNDRGPLSIKIPF